MITEIWEQIRGGLKILKDEWNKPLLDNNERADRAVRNFRQQVNEDSYINENHQIIEGKDVLARLDKLGVAFGVDPDHGKYEELFLAGPGSTYRPTTFAYSIAASASGVENGGTPYVSVPTAYAHEDSVSAHIETLIRVADHVEEFRGNITSLAQMHVSEVAGELSNLRYNDRDTYEQIVRSQEIPEKDVFISADGFQGNAYTDESGKVYTKQRALDDVLQIQKDDITPLQPNIRPA